MVNISKNFSDKDYTKGILQTIGFKEFVPYLEKFANDEDKKILQYTKRKDDKSKKKTNSSFLQNMNYLFFFLIFPVDIPQGLEILTKCLDVLKLVTKRYSKKQSKWVRNRFLGNLSRDVS